MQVAIKVVDLLKMVLENALDSTEAYHLHLYITAFAREIQKGLRKK